MNQIATKTGIESLGSGMTVLGEKQTRIPVGGKIRSGIMVLTSTGKQHPKAQDIYDAGVKAGKAWGVIEKELTDACGFQKSPLTPRNVPYFTVRGGDFVVPEVAAAILQKYGQDGPAGFQLYRFPVIFPLDAWQAVMPHGLHYYKRSDHVYWSEYDADGKRYCKMFAPVVVDKQAERAQRPWGGRATVLRAENEGLCLPEKCPEYQTRKCNLTGSFLFYVPGIPGSSAIELPTRSFYSMQQARAKLEMVAHLRGGKISGLMDGKPIFYITKKQHEVSMIDPKDGTAKKMKQWLIEIEADIDMTRVFQAGDALALAHAGGQAVAALEGPSDFDDGAADTETPPPPSAAAEDELTTKVKAARRIVADGLAIIGIAPEKFAAYGVAKWGAEWSRTLEGLKQASAAIQQAADDPKVLDAIKNWTGA